MKQLFAPIFFVFIGLAANAQDIQSLRASLMQYQFNALPLNPAYAGRVETTSFEAFYYGSFSSKQEVSRSAMVSLHGRGGTERQLGWGGVLKFHNQYAYNELNFHPAFSRIFPLADGYLSIGGTLGFNYFDVDESVLTVINSSFLSVDGGLGAFYHDQRSFIGLSMPSVFEKSTNPEDFTTGTGLPRSRSVNLHGGSLFRLNDEFYFKPTALVRYANIYDIPDKNSSNGYSLWSADVHASMFVDGSYLVGLLAGYTKPESGFEQTRIGVSATLLFGNFRFGYALQYNNQKESAVSLPASHTISFGYDFVDDPAEGRRVF